MIRLKKIKISNYKSLKNIFINIDDYLVIVGKNNSGKTNILEAINLAFTYSKIEVEDVFATKTDPFSYEKKVVVELLFVPIDENYYEQSYFDDLWMTSLGDRISFDNETTDQYFAFKTEFSYDKNKEVYVNKKNVIIDWKDNEDSVIGKTISRDDLDPFFTMYVGAQRDLALEIDDRKSQWSKLTSKINISADDETEVLDKIEAINDKIISGNPILNSMSKNLKTAVVGFDGRVSIVPVTNDLSHLYRGMNVYYYNDLIEPTSIDRLGLGIRSWSSFSIIKSYLENEKKRQASKEKSLYSLLLIEEPESHLHPQAQRHFINDINNIKSQKIVTSHSPYILSRLDLSNILFVNKEKAETKAIKLITSDFTPVELMNINNKVMNTRGELLYANYVILAEGETEEFTIPIYFKKFFGKEPFEMGVTIIGVGGGQYKPFVTLLNKLRINWCIFSDGEEEPLNAVQKTLSTLNLGSIENNNNIFVIPNNKCIEVYLVDNGYKKEINLAIDKCEGKKEYLNDYKIQQNGQKRKSSNAKLIFDDKTKTIKEYDDTDNDIDTIALKDCILESKIAYSKEIAIQICKSEKEIPKLMESMFKYVEEKLGGEL